jgi:hypothetical protein
MRTSPLVRTFVVLGLATLAACSGSDAPAASAAPQAGGADAQPAHSSTAPGAGPAAPAAATHDPVDVKMGGLTVHLEGNTISGNGPSKEEANGGFSVVDVKVETEPPLKLKVRIEPALAPQLLQEVADQQPSSFSVGEMDGARVEASMTLARPSFTLAGRTLDVAGGRLTVCGIGMGAIEDFDTITLARGEVRVEDVFRGPLPAPVAR